jgi:ERCC4-type nuclease
MARHPIPAQCRSGVVCRCDLPPEGGSYRVDPRERSARLPQLAQAWDGFDVRIPQLSVGDYLIDGSVVVERKTYADFATSLADGRLFPQAAALARSPHRPLILLEGPAPDRLPAVHAHAVQGAIASLAVMWRLL